MNIAFDVDGVVLNSIEVILEHINRVTGKNLAPADLLTWELETLGIDIQSMWDAVDYMYSQPFIESYEGAPEVLGRIHQATGEPLLFITGRRDPETAQRQLEALDWNSSVPEMIVTGGDRDKLTYLSETSTKFIVEDDLEHVRKYLDAGIGVGLMLRPWNSRTRIPVTRRFSGWPDLDRWFFGPQGRARAK